MTLISRQEVSVRRAGFCRCLRLLTLAALSAMLTGCARSVVTTTVNADGTMTRKSQFKMANLDLGLPGPNGANGKAADTGTKLSDFFMLPKGAGWTVTDTKDKNEIVYTASHTAAKGESIKHDIQVMGGEKQKKLVVLVNEASVRQIAPGRLEYREVLHWQGKPPSDLSLPDKELASFVQSALPPALATPENIADLTKVVNRAMVHLIFGPNEPMLMQFVVDLISFPEVAEFRLSKYVGGAFDEGLKQRFGAKMTADERYTVTRKVVAKMLASLKNSAASKSDPGKMMGGDAGKGDSDNPVGLTFVVKLPGKIIETNGEADPYTHQVFWALYSSAAAYGDVTLTATCEVEKQAQAPAKSVGPPVANTIANLFHSAIFLGSGR